MKWQEDIVEQSRGDKHIDTGNYNAMVRKTNANSRMLFDPRTTDVVRWTNAGKFAVLKPRSAVDPADIRFGWELTDDDVCTIYEGAINFQGLANQPTTVAETEVTLTGSTEYVYVWQEKNHSTSGIDHMASYPTSEGNRWRWPLVVFTLTNGAYEGKLIRQGDIDVMLPTQ